VQDILSGSVGHRLKKRPCIVRSYKAGGISDRNKGKGKRGVQKLHLMHPIDVKEVPAEPKNSDVFGVRSCPGQESKRRVGKGGERTGLTAAPPASGLGQNRKKGKGGSTS